MTVWHAITDFLLKAKASGLGHDAVIEILIALLGVMIAVLSLIGLLISFILAVLGVFGYQNIKSAASKMAKVTADKVASDMAAKTMREVFDAAQASWLSESQVEDVKSAAAKKSMSRPARARQKATSDKSLHKD